jgi:hypothetical protein
MQQRLGRKQRNELYCMKFHTLLVVVLGSLMRNETVVLQITVNEALQALRISSLPGLVMNHVK